MDQLVPDGDLLHQNPVAVAKVDEDDPSVVTACRDPAHQDYLFAQIFQAKTAAIMGAFPTTERLYWSRHFQGVLATGKWDLNGDEN